jgi:hypothetical protein
MWRVRQFRRRLINLFRWLPVIWKDEQWDHYYIYEVLKHKLIIMSNAIRKCGNHTLAEYDADRMMLAVRLIEKVQNEDYLIEFINDDEITKEAIEKGEAKHKKAKRILFKLLDQYIERWWD